MSIASRITTMTEHIDDIYDTVELTGVDTTGVNKNLVNVPNTLKDGFVDIINNGVDTLYENFPKVSQTGEEPTLNGVYEAPMRVELNGNTEQTTYTGKNLFNYNIIDVSTVTINDYGTIIISGTEASNGYTLTNKTLSQLCPSLQIGDTVYFYIESDFTERQYMYSSDGSFWRNGYSKTITQEMLNANIILYGGYQTTSHLKIMITKTLDTSFEPFVGGSPSPSPDYPQDIRVVKGNNTIKVTGKNLFDKDNVITGYWLLANGTLEVATQYVVSDYISVIPNTNYYLPKTDSRRLKYYDDNKEPLTTSDWDIDSGSNAQVITIPSNAKYVRFTIHKTIVDINTFQFENNTTATEFQPYQEQTYPLDLDDIELCKIGDYQDYFMKPSGKNLLLYTLESLKTINTQGTWTDNVYSYNGVDYTVNDDLTIKTSGTASGASYLIINNDLNLKSGTDYKLNGCPTGGGVSTYAIRLYTGNDYVSQTGLDFPFTFGTQNLIRINVFSGTNVDNLVFRPMVRLSSVINGEYEPNQTNKWYKKGYIGKVVLDGSEEWNTNINYTTSEMLVVQSSISNAKTGSVDIANYFKYASPTVINSTRFASQYLLFGLDINNFAYASDFKTWLSTHNVEVYYVLSTPTYEKITATTLIEQLEDLKTAKSVEGQTNITQTNEELPFILDVSGLKKD